MRKMPRRNSCEDIGWQHCIPVDGNKKIVRCNYCGKVLYGGINRLKQHLAKIRGDAAPCTKVNEEITRIMRANLEAIQAAKERKRAILQGANITTDFSGEENTLSDRKRKGKELVDEGSARGSKGKSLQGAHCLSIVPSTCSVGASVGGAGRLNSFFEPRSTQLKLKSFWDNNQARHKAHIAISDFFYHCAIPFNSINSQYFKKMLDVVGSYGPGLKPPSGKEIAGILLKNKVLSIRESFKELKASWANTGCTVMSDGWEDGKGKTLINFLVYCPRGIYFVRSVDASDIVKDPKSLFKLLDEIVKEVGEENVVQVVTENSANYVAAGRLLEANRKNIFWTPCVAHSLDLVLESIGKMKKVADCLTKGKKITKFIYNHSGVLSLMRYHTGGKDLLRPGITRFATNFLTLQSLVEHRAGLKRMILCDKWKESYHTKTPEAREVEKIILDASFWRKVEEVQKSVIPLVRVLRMVDGDEKPTMGYIYEAMDRAKLAIKEAHEDERKYGPYWRKIDERWESQLHHPLHAAAHFLNPAFRYRVDIPERPELQRGLNDCIVRLEPDKLKQIRAAQEECSRRLWIRFGREN
ncbi:uncharacterized protein LOC18448660 isoform X2 [Amborella trichopoda]|uniref:uncharacterized protein LOC18448660 isoform X2 n=1 Tax=Amborella trichopoda TaxID=13333 RepID=UPI0009C00F4A|nr:uncharacterized protein LOC18448660 isoform X2 [Amborella trichopoda]|eukprot:XP_020531950.1 uncharacterized protein LOC18448660 isoform X2 [Amborella trichopoda]